MNEILNAIDLHADVESNGISIHMAGDRDGMLILEGPEPGGEVHDGDVYRFTLNGSEHGVQSEIGFFISADKLHDLFGGSNE